MCRKSIKNAVEVKEYRILYHLRELRQQMVLLSIAFVLNLTIVIGLIGGYGSPRQALYTITDELMNSAYRFKRGWQFKNSLP